MKKILDYKAPNSITDAINLLETLENPLIISGGTRINQKKNGTYSLIDLKNCNLNYIKGKANLLRIGATTKIEELLENPLIDKFGPHFKRALITTAHTQGRNMISIGGSIATMLPWFNLLPILCILNTEIILINKNGEITVNINDFIKDKNKYLKLSIIKEILIPYPNGEIHFNRLTLTKVDYAPVILASLKYDSGIKIGISACLITPMVFEFKDTYNCDEISKEIMSSIGDKIISTNINFSKDYIKKILPTLICDLIKGEYYEN